MSKRKYTCSWTNCGRRIILTGYGWVHVTSEGVAETNTRHPILPLLLPDAPQGSNWDENWEHSNEIDENWEEVQKKL